MIDNERLRLFIEDIRGVCEHHRLALVGTCNLEGIYGEISIIDPDDPDTWGGDPNIMQRVYNFDPAPMPASAEGRTVAKKE